MVMMWLLMKCKRSIFTVTLPIPVWKVFSYWVLVSIIHVLVWQCSSTLVIAHPWNKSNWGNMRVWPSTCSLPYHTVPLCIRIYMASPRLFPYFVYFAPIVFRGIVSMLIPAEIWGRRWGRITEGAICGSSSYQHHHQYHHFNHNIISIIILLREAIKIRTWNLKSSLSPKNCEEVCF